MTDKEYLEAVLKNQDLKDDSPELRDLQKERANVEKLLRAGFPDCSPTIRYGGSKAKNTIIKENYDLDIASYFPHDDTSAGETLKAIYDNTEKALAGEELPKKTLVADQIFEQEKAAEVLPTRKY